MTTDTGTARISTPLVSAEEKARAFAQYLNEPISEKLRPRTIEQAQAFADRWAVAQQTIRERQRAEADQRQAAMRAASTCKVCGDVGADTGDRPRTHQLAGRPFTSCTRCYSLAVAVLVEQEPPSRIAAVRHALAAHTLES